MKTIKNIPKDNNFFSAYIGLVKTLNIAGMLGQIVSGLTEVGGIFVAAYLAAAPIVPQYAFYIAAFVAIIGTSIIEVGLRVALPKSVDAVLYKRYNGLHLVMTISTWVIALLLYAASTTLSFSNSTTIVEDVTKGGYKTTINIIDSTQAAKLAIIEHEFKLKKQAEDSTYNVIIEAKAGAEAAKVKSAEREIRNIRNKERRTGQSFATLKDKARLKLDNATANLNAASATVLQEKASALKAIDEKREAEILAVNAEADNKRETATLEQSGKVGKYGGGLAYFTILGNILLLISIIINQVAKKGSGIEEKVQLSQYDINPHWLKMGSEALSNRFNFWAQNIITNFANNTPPPPLPENIAELYDPSELAELRARLTIEEGEENEYKVSRKRRPIRPFGSEQMQFEDANLSYSEVNRRLRQYQKRLSRHTQIKLKAERKNRDVSFRTIQAIENNKQWVNHYKALKDNYQA